MGGGNTPLPQLGSIDVTTGTFTVIGELRDWQTGDLSPVLSSIAINSVGEMYATTNSFGGFNDSALYQVDPSTGETRLIGSFTPPNPSGIKGIVFDAMDRLLALEWEFDGRDIFELNLNDGSISRFTADALAASWYGAVEKDPNSDLWYIGDWSNGSIFSYDPATSTQTLIVGGNYDGDQNIGDLFFGEDGALYATTGSRGSGPSLWQIDIANGTATNIMDFPFPNGRGIISATSGAQAVALAIPTMGQWAFMILGLLLASIGAVYIQRRSIVME